MPDDAAQDGESVYLVPAETVARFRLAYEQLDAALEMVASTEEPTLAGFSALGHAAPLMVREAAVLLKSLRFEAARNGGTAP